jgi:thiol-disulfide isomerase/thioredoxin
MEKKKEYKKRFSSSFYTKLYILLGIVLILFTFYNVLQISSFNNVLDKQIIEAKESTRPAEIQLMSISASSCEDCYDISTAISIIESTGANITERSEFDFSSQEGEDIIRRYSIEKIPTVIIAGEINKSSSLNLKLKQMGEERDNAFVFTKQEPIFIDAGTGNIRGRISLTHITKEDCDKCVDLGPLIQQLESSGLIFKEKKTLNFDSPEGKELINKYGIEKIPVMILDKEAEVYPNIVDNWQNLGSIEDDGSYVMQPLTPPYYSIEEKKVKGLVKMTLLLDKSCDECYNPSQVHTPILQRMGLVAESEEKIDISDPTGQELIEKYSIEQIPTILLEGDVEEYPVLVNAWKGVGTQEPDGVYVFRKIDLLQQTYKNLLTNEIIKN